MVTIGSAALLVIAFMIVLCIVQLLIIRIQKVLQARRDAAPRIDWRAPHEREELPR